MVERLLFKNVASKTAAGLKRVYEDVGAKFQIIDIDEDGDLMVLVEVDAPQSAKVDKKGIREPLAAAQ